jgi:putative ABC transport system permease protein
VLLRPLPFPNPDRLVNAWQADTQGGGARLTLTGADFLSWKTETSSFESMAAVSGRGFNLAGGDQPERIEGAIVSAGFFTVLGVAPAAGQVLPSASRARAAVLSDALWRSRFGGDERVIGRTGGRRQSQIRRFLLVFEVALTLVLLIGAGLLVRSFRLVSAVDPGIRADGVLAADLPLARGRYPDGAAQARFASELLRRLRADPQIESAGLVSRLPFSPNNTVGDLTIPGREAEAFPLDLRLASDGYFDALGIPLLQGRTFTSADLMPSAPPCVVINETAARRVSSRIAVGPPHSRLGRKTPSEIVGVVGDVRHTGLDTVPRPEAWRPLGTVGWPNPALVVRGKVPAAALAAPLREAVWGLDRELPIVHLQPMEERLHSSLGLRKFALGLLSTMALVALLLATAGTYGVTSYMVAQRTRELGVRLALGATPKRLAALLIGEMVPVVALGSIIGLAAGASLSRLLRGFLFGVAPVDARTYAVLTLLLGAATCAAAAAAAVRASAVDPAEALRAT